MKQERITASSRPAQVVWLGRAFTTLIFAVWILPLLWFVFFEVFKHGQPILTLGYLILSTAGAIAAFTLPDKYFQPKSFERSGRLYKMMGVRLFKNFAPDGDLLNGRIRCVAPSHRLIRNRDSLRRYEAQTRANEKGHLVWLLTGIPAMVYGAILGCYRFAAFMFLSNVILNVYPVMLQRFNRARIIKALEQAQSSKPLPR